MSNVLPMPSKRPTILIRLDQPVKEKLERAAASDRRSVANLVEGIILDWLAARDEADRRVEPESGR